MRALSGFPLEYRFHTLEELEDYFSSDLLQCFICGRSFKHLGNHVKQGHGIDPDEYRSIYGIPWTRGLLGAASRALYSYRSQAKAVAAGFGTPEVQKRALEKNLATKRKPLQILSRKVWSNTAVEYNQRIRRKTMKAKGSSPIFVYWWKGKHQSPEHIQKRVEAARCTREGKE